MTLDIAALRHVLLSVALVVCVSSRASAQTVPCAPSSDDYAQFFRSSVAASMVGSDPEDAEWRASAKLPLTDSSAVTLVVSDSICTAAANAIAQFSGASGTPYPVWVIAVGPTRYIVFNLERTSAGRRLAAVFDTNFTWLADFIQ
jgi:hypothetical protein